MALLAVTWVIGWLLCWRLPRLPGAADATPARRVSVIVPARNEAGRLPGLLAALAAQTSPAEQVLVVDDDSEDDTSAVATAAGAGVVLAPMLPDGWTGKTWACWTGAQQARGEVLVFLDADTEPELDLLARVVDALDRRQGLLSVMPYHRMHRQYERLSAFFTVISLMGIGAASARRSAPVTGAYGPFLACDRRDYDAVGGHHAIPGAVVDDVALAQRFRRAGLPVCVAGGRGAINFRLYGGGGDLVEGWSKNFASGAGPRRRCGSCSCSHGWWASARRRRRRFVKSWPPSPAGPGPASSCGSGSRRSRCSWRCSSARSATTRGRRRCSGSLSRRGSSSSSGRSWSRHGEWSGGRDVRCRCARRPRVPRALRRRDASGRADARLILAASPWFFLWNPWWLGLAMLGYGIAANVPCLAIQRYNRARLLRMIPRPSQARTG